MLLSVCAPLLDGVRDSQELIQVRGGGQPGCNNERVVAAEFEFRRQSMRFADREQNVLTGTEIIPASERPNQRQPDVIVASMQVCQLQNPWREGALMLVHRHAWHTQHTGFEEREGST